MRAAMITFCLALAACAERPSPPSPYPAPTHQSPAGAPVALPAWLPADLTAETLDEIDAAHAAMGVAPGEVLIWVDVPVIDIGDRLVRGAYYRGDRVARVGWRLPGGDRPLLPALEHELGHHRFGAGFEHQSTGGS